MHVFDRRVCVDTDDVLASSLTVDKHGVVRLLNLTEFVEGFESLACLATGLDARQADLGLEVEEDRDVWGAEALVEAGDYGQADGQ